MTCPAQFPIYVGSARKTPVGSLAKSCADRITQLYAGAPDQIVVTLAHDYCVWLERPGDYLPDEWVCNVDRIRSPADLCGQITDDLRVAKSERLRAV